MTPIVLHTFGPAFGVPDPSPFVVKAITLLKMSGLPFVEQPSGVRKAPKGKLPWIEDGGAVIADSTLIRLYLEQAHRIDFDAGLSPRERAIGWAAERMLEEHLYWFVVYERWLEDDNFRRGPATFFAAIPSPIRPVVIAMVRRKIRNGLNGQGLGRHGEADRLALAKGDLDAVAALIGDKPYLGGDAPCGADATLFGFTVSILRTALQPKLAALAGAHPDLVAYTDRMQARFFPEVVTAGPGSH